MMNGKELIIAAKNDLESHRNLLRHMQSRKSKLPDGCLATRDYDGEEYHLHIHKVEGKRVDDPISHYGKDAGKMISELKERSNIIHGMPIVKRNVNALEKFIDNYKYYNPLDFKYGNAADGRLYLDNDICINDWINEAYESNPYRPEDLIFETRCGINVRSKSESLISDINDEFFIPKRYECKVVIDGQILYPDFLLVRPFDRKLFAWEHFGIIDDPKYLIRNIPKLDIYPKGGFYLGYNFILTWETRHQPLTRSVVVEKLREHNFI